MELPDIMWEEVVLPFICPLESWWLALLLTVMLWFDIFVICFLLFSYDGTLDMV